MEMDEDEFAEQDRPDNWFKEEVIDRRRAFDFPCYATAPA